jgi:hypothetical protein
VKGKFDVAEKATQIGLVPSVEAAVTDTQDYDSSSLEPGSADGAVIAPVEPLPIVALEDVDVKAEPDWLIRGLLPAAACAFVVADPKVGKSWFVDDAALAVASGKPFLRREVARQAPVLFVPAEDPIPSWASRLEGLALARGLERKGLPIHAVDVPAVSIDDGETLGRLRVTIERLGAALVVLDPLAMLHGADENNAGEMLAVLRGLRRVSRETGAAVLVTHHASKPNGTNRRRTHRIRGSSALFGWADVIVMLELVEKAGVVRVDTEARAFRPPLPFGIWLEEAKGDDGRQRYWHEVEPLEDDELAKVKTNIVRALEKVGGPLTRNALFEKVGGARGKFLDAVRVLLIDGRLREVGRQGVELVSKEVSS